MKNRIKLDAIMIVIIFFSLLILTIFKVKYVDSFLYVHTGVRYLGGTRVFLNDSVILLSIIAINYLSYLKKTPRIASILLRSIAFLVIVIYAIDYFVITNFATHLTIMDAFKYGSYSLKYISQIHGRMNYLMLLIAILLSIISAYIILSSYKIKTKTPHAIFFLSIITLSVTSVASFSVDDKYSHSWIYKNVISHNLVILSEKRNYSEDFIENISFKDKFECIYQSEYKPENIILLMVESLSNYQSYFFSGINNWTPNLDEIARKNISYNNFYANGFTTEDAEVSLLTGKLPIYQPSSYSNGGGNSFNGFFNIQESLPRVLKRSGYVTEFLTTADLDFSGTGDWAKSIGFDYIEGHEHKFYDNMERFHFKAAPDKALYHRIIERIKNNGDKKHFYFIKTVSTHHPFINPETKIKSESEAFQYADKQLGVFYRNLIDIDFFENGMLIIVGDHHAMVPIKENEIRKYGATKASAMVPLIISYGNKMQIIRDEQYQQVDIFHSLKGLMIDTLYYSNWVGNIFHATPAKYIAHRRGDNRDIITVISNEVEVAVKLDGDNTRVISEYPKGMLKNRSKNEILNRINSSRIFLSDTTSNSSEPCL